MKEFTDSDYGFVQKATSGGHPAEAAFHPSGEGSEEAAAAWDVAVGATLACDGAPPTLGDMALADGAAATESPCCSLRCSDTWYPIRGYQTNSLTTPRAGPERHVPVPNAAHPEFASLISEKVVFTQWRRGVGAYRHHNNLGIHLRMGSPLPSSRGFRRGCRAVA